ncbi:2-polyprenyl-3-methyl-6-methoxy-1,4-benzoquinone monooxygenase [Azonexus sp. R2A-61]|uniref:2-polyprenyl-3-methyl-6-methoxy-1,4-benzoquinone monooxygenase n=1 Tax=Azonexus sp. R2A61 TaxID=2744443 RepID=UPI001F2AC026
MHLDDLIVGFDRALRTLAAPASSVRPVPGADVADVLLGDSERRHVCGLMRVNHSGEVCAQALYQGQALTSRREEVKLALKSAADEEVEHLAWTEARLGALGGRVSLLNPLWYVGSLTIGVVAGVLGDKWNLGFLAETERQVEAHLDGHLDSLPSADLRSRAIVAQMRDDEAGHAKMAMDFGAAELPAPVRVAMKLTARFLTGLSYHI